MNKTAIALIFLLVGGFSGFFLAKNHVLPKEHAEIMNEDVMHNDQHSGHRDMSMRQMMDQMNQTLATKKDKEFDQAFLEEMIIHHEGAIKMAELVKINTKRPELLKLADAIITAQSNEIDQMRSWMQTWFGIQSL